MDSSYPNLEYSLFSEDGFVDPSLLTVNDTFSSGHQEHMAESVISQDHLQGPPSSDQTLSDSCITVSSSVDDDVFSQLTNLLDEYEVQPIQKRMRTEDPITIDGPEELPATINMMPSPLPILSQPSDIETIPPLPEMTLDLQASATPSFPSNLDAVDIIVTSDGPQGGFPNPNFDMGPAPAAPSSHADFSSVPLRHQDIDSADCSAWISHQPQTFPLFESMSFLRKLDTKDILLMGFFDDQLQGTPQLPAAPILPPRLPPTPAPTPPLWGSSHVLEPLQRATIPTTPFMTPIPAPQGQRFCMAPSAPPAPAFHRSPLKQQQGFTFVDDPRSMPRDFVANPEAHGRWDDSRKTDKGKPIYLNGPRNKRPHDQLS